MQIKLGAKIRTSDGHHAGEVKKIVWDPDSNEVRDFVVTTGVLLGHDVLISRDVLESASVNGDEVVVNLTKQELESLDHYDDSAFAPPPYGWMAPATYTYPIAAYVFPTDAAAVPLSGPTESQKEIKKEHGPSIAKGMRVKDTAGKTVGVVKEVRIDDSTGELRSIVVEERDPIGLSTTRTMDVPADHIDVGDGEIHLIDEVRGTHVAKQDGI